MSVPNQKIITIIKPRVAVPPFLQIETKEWMEAARRLSSAGLVLYLYLANNQNNYKLELSPADIVEKERLMSRRSYYRALEDLRENKYLCDNVFYTTPIDRREKEATAKKYIDSFSH